MSILKNNAEYHLWNPFTNLEEFVPYKDIGPMTLVRGEGPYVYNAAGKKFINASGSLWNVAVGHGRQELAEIAYEQMKTLCYSSCFQQTHPKAVELADKLCKLTGNVYDKVYLGCNGSEAVETAVKITRQYFRQSDDSALRGKYKVISFKGAYHGVSYGAMALCGDDLNEKLYSPLPEGILHINPPHYYHNAYDTDNQEECERRCAESLRRLIEEEGPETVAAFIAEPVMGEIGILPISSKFFNTVTKICKEYNMLVIADEVTTGFGRTGSLFASENWKVRPDIMCLGKGISSGYLPVSAVMVKSSVYKNFIGKEYFQHGSTSSGNPVCSAVAIGNIDIILRERLIENSAEIGTYLLDGLNEIMKERNIIGDVRGKGLMIGIELVKDRKTKEPYKNSEVFNIVADCASQGLITYYNQNIIALFPPLIIDRKIADDILTVLNSSLKTGKTESIKKKMRLFSEFAASKKTTAINKN
ncbi:MAG: aspartate aminotransferase family protein [Ruminococcus sp.]|nr:aspartate aminotransferase family protein [Ruminococcus sp.]